MLRADRRIGKIRNHRPEPSFRPGVEFVCADPDHLRESVGKALSSLSADERSTVRNKLLYELKKAGLRVRQCLLMLGVAATTPDELTPPEVASLIRYVRLTEPKILLAVTEPLSELLIVPGQAEGSDLAA
jgi:hypothetical protein